MPEFTRQHFEISVPGFQSAKNQATFHGGLPRLCSSYRVCASIKLCMSNSQWLFDLHCWSFTHLVPLCQEHIPLFLPNQWHLSWWRHQMETFSVLLAICEGNSAVPGEFPSQGQWREALMFSLLCVWINDWVNNLEAGDLRRYLAHYDVTLMLPAIAFPSAAKSFPGDPFTNTG